VTRIVKVKKIKNWDMTTKFNIEKLFGDSDFRLYMTKVEVILLQPLCWCNNGKGEHDKKEKKDWHDQQSKKHYNFMS